MVGRKSNARDNIFITLISIVIAYVMRSSQILDDDHVQYSKHKVNLLFGAIRDLIRIIWHCVFNSLPMGHSRSTRRQQTRNATVQSI